MAYGTQRALLAALLNQKLVGDTPTVKILLASPVWTDKARAAVAAVVGQANDAISAANIDVSSFSEPEDAPEVTGARVVTVNSGSVIVRHEWNEELTCAIKDWFDRPRWDRDNRAWRIAAGGDEKIYLAALRYADRYGYSVTPSLVDAALASVGVIAHRIEASRASDADFEVAGLGGVLRPFQQAGVQYIVECAKGRALVGDEMGLGKTISSLASLQAMNSFPAVVVCPSFLRTNWLREAKKWLPGKAVTVVKTGKDKIQPADVIIISYDIVVKQLGALRYMGIKALVCDESHYLKNHKAKRTEAVAEFAKTVPVRLLLTGTPIVNRPSELISQLSILHRLNDLGGFWHFAERYCDGHHGDFGYVMEGATNLSELREKLRATCYLRREKKDVLTELPPIQRSVIAVEIDNRREYDTAVRDIVTYISETKAREKAFSSAATGMTDAQREQFAATVSYESSKAARRAETLVRIEKLRQLAARGKIAAVEEWIREFGESGKKLVVFATHQEIVEAIASRFPGSVRITGAESKEARQSAVDRFQTDPQVTLAVCTFKAAGVGLTLTAAADVLSVELAWTSVDHDQAEARCHRMGQQANSINSYFMIADETIDDDIYALIERKRGIIDNVNSTERADAVTTVLDNLLAKSGVDIKKIERVVAKEFKTAANDMLAAQGRAA